MSARLRSLAVSAAVVVLERVDIDIQCGLRGSVLSARGRRVAAERFLFLSSVFGGSDFAESLRKAFSISPCKVYQGSDLNLRFSVCHGYNL